MLLPILMEQLIPVMLMVNVLRLIITHAVLPGNGKTSSYPNSHKTMY
ncbi:MAG: hypothetical protein V3U75_01530 [Methylococcaceae bacterium]